MGPGPGRRHGPVGGAAQPAALGTVRQLKVEKLGFNYDVVGSNEVFWTQTHESCHHAAQSAGPDWADRLKGLMQR